MTAFVTKEFVPELDDQPAPSAVPATETRSGTHQQRRQRLLPAVVVLVIAAWLLSGFWLSVS